MVIPASGVRRHRVIRQRMAANINKRGGESGLTRILRVRDMNDFDRWSEREMALYYVSDVASLIEAAEAVIGFCDLEPGYKGGALIEAAKKLLEQVE